MVNKYLLGDVNLECESCRHAAPDIKSKELRGQVESNFKEHAGRGIRCTL